MDHDFLEQDESEWVQRARDGDGVAFEALFQAYYPMTFALAYNMIGRHHDAEEIVQEAFIKAARALPRFRGESTFKTWLYRIAMNTVSDFRRRHRETAELDENLSAPQPEQHPMRETLLRALDRLSESQRRAVVLTYFDGLSHAEAAEVLHCAEATVSWRIFSAKKKLKHALRQSAFVERVTGNDG